MVGKPGECLYDSSMKRIVILYTSLPPLLALRLAVVYALKKLLNSEASINYSQTGEDAVIRSLLDETRPGVYVDVGCNDPIRSSNTLSLYLHGWHGVNVGKWRKRGERMVKTGTLDSMLQEHLPAGTEIDLLSVDVEGHDLNVLRSVDLDTLRPKLIVVEMHHLDLNRSLESPITHYLQEREFRHVGYDTLNGYFVDARAPRAGLRLP